MNEFTLPDWVTRVRTFWGLIGMGLTNFGINIAFLSEEVFTTAYYDEITGGITILIGAALTLYNIVMRGIVKPGTIVKQSELTLTPSQKASFWLPFGRKYAVA